MKPGMRVAAGLLAVALFNSGCYGPFYLTRKVWKFNGEVSDNKWVVELAYLIMVFLPIYGLAGAADAIIFNSIEFWTGDNPLVDDTANLPQTKRIVRGDSEAVFTRQVGEHGPELLIEQFTKGQPAGTLRVSREGNAMIGRDASGAAVMRAETIADGSVVVSNAQGQQIARYTGEQAEKFAASVQQ